MINATSSDFFLTSDAYEPPEQQTQAMTMLSRWALVLP